MLGHGHYVGPLKHLQGEPALLMRSEKPGIVLAQFDDLDRFDGDKAPRLAFGWHEFREEDFKYDDCEEPAVGSFRWELLIIGIAVLWAIVISLL